MNYLRSLILCAAASSCYAGAIGVDGVLGPEWAGITPKNIPFVSGAPTSNFGSPTGGTNAVSYAIYLRSDSSYVYGFFQTLPSLGHTAVDNFVNLYFDTNPSANNGSDLGFEINNLNAFIPGVPGSHDVSSFLTLATSSGPFPTDPTATEFALPISFFTTDPLGMKFPKATEGRIVLRMSQSFGYSVVGGASFGPDRLGSIALADSVPEPSTLSLLGLGAFALIGYRRRRK